MALLNPSGCFAKLLRVSALAAVLVWSIATIAAQPARPSEYDVKAVFLYNFTMFVTWPTMADERPDAPVLIGVLGTDPFGRRLEDALRGERVRGRPLQAQRFQRVEDALHCHVLFLARSEEPRLPELLRQLEGRAILTVSDIPGFGEAGGMVELARDSDRTRLVVNVDAARDAGLAFSAQLLRPAHVVRTRKTSLYSPFLRGTLLAQESLPGWEPWQAM